MESPVSIEDRLPKIEVEELAEQLPLAETAHSSLFVIQKSLRSRQHITRLALAISGSLTLFFALLMLATLLRIDLPSLTLTRTVLSTAFVGFAFASVLLIHQIVTSWSISVELHIAQATLERAIHASHFYLERSERMRG
jgi:hypothetical protein